MSSECENVNILFIPLPLQSKSNLQRINDDVYSKTVYRYYNLFPKVHFKVLQFLSLLDKVVIINIKLFVK